MEGTKQLVEMGFLPLRYRTNSGNYKPHFSITFKSGGERRTFGIDTTRNSRKDDQYFLITHAHSDHNGKSAMLSERSIASDKTATTLELRHDQYYQGTKFTVGETIDIDGVTVKTYNTHHSIGATAFYWENDVGVRILVTGDVKDFRELPRCDVLVTEATYGNPTDPDCIFTDDLDAFAAALVSHRRVGFGAYSFGKAQRVVSLIRKLGYNNPIEMDKNSLRLTRHLLGDDAGELAELGELDGRLCITSPWHLHRLPIGVKKFVLTGQKHYEHQTICLSDHLDFEGLKNMVYTINPELTLVYHPESGNSTIFSDFLNQNCKRSISLADLSGTLDEDAI
ncbi:MAG TPA: MBL fold metallo-hydrolase [Methanocella sp.]|nr:MBL fold metallo-hydrolase [Methanocella sp.]